MSIPSSVTSISSPVTSISSLSISRYRHDPLAFEDSIRILVLEPGEYCEPVHCHLVPTRLSDTPIYDAISYVWGTDEPSNEVFICGKKFLIKTNLYNALRRFRHSPKKDGSQKASDHDLQRKLWVDVLCVNQADIPERNQQVQNMKRVYAGARSVLIWLRDSIESDRLAFDVFKSVERATKGRNHVMYERNRFLDEVYSHNIPLDTLVAVFKISNCAWFRRIWVLQELAVAVNPRVICGENETTWIALYITARTFLNTITEIGGGTAIGRSPNITNLKVTFIQVCRMHNIRCRCLHGQSPTLCDLLTTTPDLESSEPRDKVYALRGLLREEELPRLKVDYALSIGELFGLVTRNVLSHDMNPFRLWCLTALSQSTPISDSIPSWVPNYERPAGRNPQFAKLDRIYNACGLVKSQISFTGFNQKILCLRGHIFAKVSDCLWVYPKASIPEEIVRWYQKCRQYVLQIDYYPTGEDISSCWWRLLVGDIHLNGLKTNRAVKGFGIHYLDPRVSDIMTSQVELETDDVLRGAQSAYRIAAHQISTGMSLGRTENGYLTWIPPRARSGDYICIFAGAPCPFVIRGRPEGDYTLVGGAYVHGIMYGEALDLEGFTWDEIRIH